MNSDPYFKVNIDTADTALPPQSQRPRVAIIGGDARILSAARRFAEFGYSVALCGFDTENAAVCDLPPSAGIFRHVGDALADATVILLPLPTTRDGADVWCPLGGDMRISLSEISDAAARGSHLFGGKLPTDFCTDLAQRGISVTDYYGREDVQVANAHITAEGALMYAMTETERTLHGAKVAVIGYGRIGHFLSSLLLSLGADVTVLARREESLAWARCEGAKTAKISKDSISSLSSGYDIIFNTVPYPLIGAEVIYRMKPDTLLVELASSPGGFDAAAARRSAVKIIWASSIPGKYAPVSAGNIIADAVLSVLSDAAERSDV